MLDVGLSLELNRYGVLPRVAHGLVGVLAAPLLHGDLEHLIGNSVPVFVLGWSLMYFFPDISGRVVGIAWLPEPLWLPRLRRPLARPWKQCVRP